MTTEAPATIPIRPARKRRTGALQLDLPWQRFRHQAHLRYQWWTKPHTPYRPVFVLASHRSGSNLLIDYLNRLPGVQSHHEILCRVFANGPTWLQTGPWRTIGHIRRSLHLLTAPTRGCKLMLDQLEFSRVKLTDILAAFPDAKFIVLYRQSLAEQFVSKETAKATNQWTLSSDQERKQAKVRINPAALREYCERLRRWYHNALTQPWLPERALLVSYEQLAADPRRLIQDGICPLLQVPPGEPESHLRKQNTLPLPQRVENYREVAGLLNSPLCQQNYSWPGQQKLRRRAA